jgi:uncharacterized membrane protein
MVAQANRTIQEVIEMHSNKIRTAVIAVAASLSLAGAAIAPAASQAQWHTLVVGGVIITHSNFTEGGVSPCTRISGELGKANSAVGDYKEWIGRHDAGEATAISELANAEAAVARARREAFEYGCDIAPA